MAIILSIVLKMNPVKEFPKSQPKERVLIIYAEDSHQKNLFRV